MKYRGLLIGVLVIAAGIALYFFVAQPNPSDYADESFAADTTASEPFAWHNWNSGTFARAVASNRLVFLLIYDPLSPPANATMEQAGSDPLLKRLLANRTVPVRINRQQRPDIAERYAEQRSLQAMLLLPTGEALTVLPDSLNAWAKKISETDKYWRGHRGDIKKRIDDFWSEYETSQSSHKPPRMPSEKDLGVVDDAVQQFEAQALSNHDVGIWRVDISAYLNARAATQEWAEVLRRKIHAARVAQRADSPAVLKSFPTEGIARLIIEELNWKKTEIEPTDLLTALRQELDSRRSEPSPTAAGVAARALADFDLKEPVDSKYPGNWLDAQSPDDRSLPHIATGKNGLDGYLPDALEWLDYLVAQPDSASLMRAASLGDSLWNNLWSKEHNALRDKPLRDTPVREIEVFPRPQLGRLALIFMQLEKRTADGRWLKRADECLDGFAPYLQDSKAAAAYYGLALLRRLSFET